MPHIVNPFGRVVAIENAKEYNNLLDKTGFRKATESEVDAVTAGRIARIERMEIAKLRLGAGETPSVYLATVSTGGRDGYGVASDTLVAELKRLGVHISRSQEGQGIGVLFHNPYSVLQLENKYRIIYTMFESTKIPEDWIEYLNAADMVIVPSTWCASVFAESGVETTVLPLGYNHRLFTYKKREAKRKSHETFTFLHYNAYNLRKGFLELVNAFTKEFEPDEPVKLILKTTLKKPPFPFPPSQYPNIEVLEGSISDKQLVDLCHRSDAFVFPSRGEGFGITPLEAMATGMTAIVPNSHGISEYFDKDYMYEVNVKGECASAYSRYKGVDTGKMFLCDVDHLRQQMRYVYEHQEEAIEKGRKAAEYVKNWTFEKSAIKLKEIFDDVGSKPPAERPLQNVLELERV